MAVRPAHATDDRDDEHQYRYEVEDEEAPLPVRLRAFAAQDAKAGEEKLDRNRKNEQPGKPDEELARDIQMYVLQIERTLDSSDSSVSLGYSETSSLPASRIRGRRESQAPVLGTLATAHSHLLESRSPTGRCGASVIPPTVTT